jgi:23S rRNA pseudouridine1911/1915/1917 synthase
MKNYSVPEEVNNQRIDLALVAMTDVYSRAHAQRLIRHQLVKINGKIAKKGNRVKTDNVVEVGELILEESKFEAIDIPLTILYEDDDLLVVVKPSGLLTHPSAHDRKNTLVNALLHHCGDRLSGIGGEKRPGIVHRLDKDTSGILMVAKHDGAHKDLARQLQERKVEKHYLALVEGIMDSSEGTIDAPLMKTRPKRGKTRVVVSPDSTAKDSVTKFWVKETFANRFSLLDVQIITGRMHQIRVHLGAINHPIIGDKDYGYGKVNNEFEEKGLQRQFLHAFRLKFKHPRTEKWMEFEAPLPEDLQNVIDQLEEAEA